MPKKSKTLDQIQSMQAKAVRFLRDVVGDPDRADDFESMSPDEYAEHKRITIENPDHTSTEYRTRRIDTLMATKARPTYADMKDRVAELEEENQTLIEKLDSILDIAADEEEDEDQDEDEDEDEDEEDPE